jgi:hypothetical protein
VLAVVSSPLLSSLEEVESSGSPVVGTGSVDDDVEVASAVVEPVVDVSSLASPQAARTRIR